MKLTPMAPSRRLFAPSEPNIPRARILRQIYRTATVKQSRKEKKRKKQGGDTDMMGKYHFQENRDDNKVPLLMSFVIPCRLLA